MAATNLTSVPKTARELYVDVGMLNRLFSNLVPKDLFRFVEEGTLSSEANLLDPVLKPFTTSTGRVRSPDVVRKEIDGVGYVIPKMKTGVSLFAGPADFNKPGEHYVIPQGTPIPPGLVITEDNLNPKFKYVHYSIGPAQMMQEAHFIFLVRRLASHAVKMTIWMSQNPGKVYPHQTA